MTDVDYKKMLEAMKGDLFKKQQELGNCIKQQEQLEKEIASVRQITVALSKMVGEEFVEEDALGLTDAIRQAFKANDKPMSAINMRVTLEQLGYDISKYGNALASIHTVIKRLVLKKEIVQKGTNSESKAVYVWGGK